MYFSCWPTQTPPIHWMGMLQPCTFTGEPYFGSSWIETKFVFYESVYRRPEEYKKKVAEYVKKYATEDALRETDKVRKSRGHCRIILFSLSGGSLVIVREFDVRFFGGRGKRHGTITSQPAGWGRPPCSPVIFSRLMGSATVGGHCSTMVQSVPW